MAVKAINIFDDENFSKGGGLFPDGPTRWEKFRFVSYDYGKPGNDQVCLMGLGQPLNADGSDNGEPKAVYWPTTKGEKGRGDVELVSPIKGEKGSFDAIGISESNAHGKLFGLADFSIFRDNLKVAAKINPELIDMEEAGSAISSLDGLVTEVGKYVVPENPNATKVAKDDAQPGDRKKEPWKIVIITEILDPKTFGKGKGKAKAKPEPEAPVKSKAKDKAKDVEVGDDPEEIVSAYCDSELNDDKEGESPLSFKIGLAAWATKKLGKDADVAREAQSALKEQFAAILKARGWKLDGGKLAKEE